MKNRKTALALTTLLILTSLAFQTPVSPVPTPTPDGQPGPPGPPPSIVLSGPGIAAIVAFLLSLALTYVPNFAARWETFEHKRTALAIAGLVVAFAIAGLDYVGAVDASVPRPFFWAGLAAVATAWFTFAGAAQLVYTTIRLPPPDPESPGVTLAELQKPESDSHYKGNL